MGETRAIRLKRLHMRSMRRGIKEMDIILSRFAEARLGALEEGELTLYEALLNENDQDIYQWVTGQIPAPDHLQPMIDQIAKLTTKGA